MKTSASRRFDQGNLKVDLPEKTGSWAPRSTTLGLVKIYCSPACGGNCTKADYDRAVREAKKLLKTLRGQGWTAIVYENLGWYFKVKAGPLEVCADFRGPLGCTRYACSLHEIVPDNFWSTNPNEAVERTVAHCIAGASKSLASLFDACGASDMKHEFYRTFTQLPVVEFLRRPGG